jgi:hypothetical protein
MTFKNKYIQNNYKGSEEMLFYLDYWLDAFIKNSNKENIFNIYIPTLIKPFTDG